MYRYDCDIADQRFVRSSLYDEDIYNVNRRMQIYTYNHFIKYHGHETDWVAFYDTDEFLWLGQFETIGELVEYYGQKCDLLALNDVVYGHNYHISTFDNLVIYSNLTHENRVDPYIKSLARVNQIESINNPHFMEMKNKKSIYIDGESAVGGTRSVQKLDIKKSPHIKHYKIVFVEECIRKKFFTDGFYRHELACINDKLNRYAQCINFHFSEYDTSMPDRYGKQLSQMLGKQIKEIDPPDLTHKIIDHVAYNKKYNLPQRDLVDTLIYYHNIGKDKGQVLQFDKNE